MPRSRKPPRELLRRIRLLVLDVDGTLTDGRLYYGKDGEALKAFDVRDGHGLRLLRIYGGVRLAALSCTPADAAPEVLREVRWVARRRAGRGAVRELCEVLLDATVGWPPEEKTPRQD